MHGRWLPAPHGSELQPAGASRGSERLKEHLGVHKLCTVVFVGWPLLLLSCEASAGQSRYGVFSALLFCLSFSSCKDRAHLRLLEHYSSALLASQFQQL